MTHYLLRWNPAEWPNERYTQYFESFERGEPLRWSCGNTKKTKPGDHFFLMKSGKEGRGVIGSGVILGEPWHAKHFNESKAALGKSALYVNVRFEYLMAPKSAIPIHRHELDSAGLASKLWDTQGSGQEIPSEIAFGLTALWHQRAAVNDFSSADEVVDDQLALLEGAKKQITVNAYERSADARRKCLDKWGYNCSVCSFRFEAAYGPLGKGYMHVHHLRPLSSIGAEYFIDPIADLRPVCPNCHAMLHRKSPPISIEELQSVVATYR